MNSLDRQLRKYIHTVDKVTGELARGNATNIEVMIESLQTILAIVGSCYGKINETLENNKHETIH
jgi:hypothetical protein|tara:strand:+ start:4426 stop:4620 length:195 start_codon:yes stop_codon:yes gene_type:complete